MHENNFELPKCLVFLDTSSLLDSCWNGDERRGQPIRFDREKEATFWRRELPNLIERGTLILPLRNYDELMKHSNSSVRPELRDRAKYVMKKLSPFRANNEIEIFGDQNDPFADATLLSVALRFRTQYTLYFITQDNALARDLDSIRRFESVQPRGNQRLEIRRVTRSGRLGGFRNLQPPMDDPERDYEPTVTNTGEPSRWWNPPFFLRKKKKE